MRNQLLRRAGAFLVLFAALAVPASAAPTDKPDKIKIDKIKKVVPVRRQTPEIDPGVARSGATILIGGLLILNDRRRRRSA